MDTLVRVLVSGLELLRADAAQVARMVSSAVAGSGSSRASMPVSAALLTGTAFNAPLGRRASSRSASATRFARASRAPSAARVRRC